MTKILAFLSLFLFSVAANAANPIGKTPDPTDAVCKEQVEQLKKDFDESTYDVQWWISHADFNDLLTAWNRLRDLFPSLPLVENFGFDDTKYDYINGLIYGFSWASSFDTFVIVVRDLETNECKFLEMQQPYWFWGLWMDMLKTVQMENLFIDYRTDNRNER